jgi:hypothetical protein
MKKKKIVTVCDRNKRSISDSKVDKNAMQTINIVRFATITNSHQKNSGRYAEMIDPYLLEN